ncbi:hypothetical protein ABEF93_007057 [Exophiala dermatitidis]
MSAYLITGCARGIGLQLTKTLAARPESEVRFIAATGRREATALKELTQKYPGRVVFVPLDTTDDASVKAAVKEVERLLGPNGGLDVLINNAGVLNLTPEGIEKMADLMSTLEINVNGPQRVTAAFVPLLRKGSRKLIVNVSSTLGSMTLAKYFPVQPAPAYKVSKAALNMLTVQWALALANEGFTVIAVSPGWLKTDLGSEAADLPVEVGVGAVLDIVEHAAKEQNGKFFDIHVPGDWRLGELQLYQGGEAPW